MNAPTLSKEESRRQWSELRTLVCEWDPISVMDDPDWPRDEYDCLLGPILRLLENGASESDIASYLRTEISEHFGLSPEHCGFAVTAVRIRSWFLEGWARA